MATKTLNTRIQLKHDSYSAWNTNNPVLLDGEIAVVVVPASAGQATNEPTVLFKVGDGTKTFNELSYISGLSADVYSWAKASTKPTYTATEISGLSDYIAETTMVDTDTQYQLEQDGTDGNKIRLNYKNKDDVNFTQGAWITIPQSVSEIALASGTNNGTVKLTVDGTVTDNIAVRGLKSAAYTESSAYATSTQGGLADSALQPGDISITSGTNNGTIKLTVDGTATDNIAVKGLGSAAYTNSSAYATSTQGTKADGAMPKSGGTFTGAVTLSGAPSSDLHAATKKYVDDSVSGLSGAMHFKGEVVSLPVSPYTGYASGDVVLCGNKEYVFNGTVWNELGDESSFALKTTTVNGKALSSNVTLTASDVGAATSSDIITEINKLDFADTADATKYISAVNEVNGKISVIRAALPTTLKNPNALTAGGKTYDGSVAVTITASDLGALTAHQDISGKQDNLTFDGIYNASSNKAATVSSVTSRINALDSSVAATAADGNKYSVITGVTEVDGKLTAKTEVKLESIAKTGNVNDLIQSSGDTIIFNCGSSSVNI